MISDEPQLHTSDPDLYEQYVIVALNNSLDLWREMSPALCWNSKYSKFENNFSVAEYYPIYRAMHGWREMQLKDSSDKFKPVTEFALKIRLRTLTSVYPDPVDPDDIPELLELFKNICTEIPAEEAITVVAATWRVWLTSRRTAVHANRLRSVDPSNVEETISDMRKDLSSIYSDDKNDIASDIVFGEYDWSDEDHVERVPLGKDFMRLNEILGGGLGRKESGVIVAPTGGGKTVFATQLAGDLAMRGSRVLYVSTEEGGGILMPRAVSSLSANKLDPGERIPYDAFKDGGRLQNNSKLTYTQIHSVRNIQAQLGRNLIFVDWTEGGVTAANNLEAALEKRMNHYNTGFDVLILDWVGGALVHGVTDPGMKREIYLQTLNMMRVMANRYNIACIATMQTTAKMGRIKRVTDEHIADCKGIQRECTWAIGISALLAPDTEDSEEQVTTSDTQYINTIKSRRAVGKFYQIKKDFAFQKFSGM